MISSTLADHLRIDRYGDFALTDAIRPARHLPVVPREGFRVETYREPRTGNCIPVLVASVSRERLFDTFLDLLRPLGPTVDVILETSHDSAGPTHRDLMRERIDLPVLMSHCCEFEDVLLNDGCAGVAVISTRAAMEVQFDEHKLLVIYAHDLEQFEIVLRQAGLMRDDSMKFLTEGEHMHATDPKHQSRFEQLCSRVGVGESAEHVNG